MAQGKKQPKFGRNLRIRHRDNCDTDGRRWRTMDKYRFLSSTKYVYTFNVKQNWIRSCWTYKTSKFEWSWHWPFKVTKVNVITLRNSFLLIFHSTIWPNSGPLRDIKLSISLSVNCEGVIGLPIYGFILIFHSNIWPNSGHLREIKLRNVSKLEFDLSISLKVKCEGVIGPPIQGFLLMFYSNIWPNSAPLRDISFQNLRDRDTDLSRTSLRLNVIVLMDSPYMLSYWCLI